jgi:hypothetical protein
LGKRLRCRVLKKFQCLFLRCLDISFDVYALLGSF